mgnify:CR=1 FL=1
MSSRQQFIPNSPQTCLPNLTPGCLRIATPLSCKTKPICPGCAPESRCPEREPTHTHPSAATSTHATALILQKRRRSRSIGEPNSKGSPVEDRSRQPCPRAYLSIHPPRRHRGRRAGEKTNPIFPGTRPIQSLLSQAFTAFAPAAADQKTNPISKSQTRLVKDAPWRGGVPTSRQSQSTTGRAASVLCPRLSGIEKTKPIVCSIPIEHLNDQRKEPTNSHKPGAQM